MNVQCRHVHVSEPSVSITSTDDVDVVRRWVSGVAPTSEGPARVRKSFYFHCVIFWKQDNEQSSNWIGPCASTRGRGALHTPLLNFAHMALVDPSLWNRHLNQTLRPMNLIRPVAMNQTLAKGALRLGSKPARNNSNQDLNSEPHESKVLSLATRPRNQIGILIYCIHRSRKVMTSWELS